MRSDDEKIKEMKGWYHADQSGDFKDYYFRGFGREKNRVNSGLDKVGKLKDSVE